jgi:hypothetical protein
MLTGPLGRRRPGGGQVQIITFQTDVGMGSSGTVSSIGESDTVRPPFAAARRHRE